jgi:HEAT repeat protein
MSEPKKLSAEQHNTLLQRLHSTDELVRIQAAVRLTGSGVDAVAIRPQLEAALTDNAAHVRRLAAWVLTRLPRQAAA